jgi:DnaK suppressor protein
MDDLELKAFRGRLEQMRARLMESVEGYESDIREAVVAPGDVSTRPTHLGDLSSEGVDDYVTLAPNEDHLLDQVAKAITRMDKGTFGRCERCGKEIAKVRLDAIPYTPHCVECARQTEPVGET